jgi:glycosyltransferase involved in cell wall biosynthesis
LDRWRGRAREAGVDARVDFLGFRTDVPVILQASDLLVAPVRYEAYGLGVHEALCCGLPAIVSAASGIAERYPPSLHELLLPDPEDVSDLVVKLKRWRERESFYNQATAAFGLELRQRTWDDMAHDLPDICERTDWGLEGTYGQHVIRKPHT